MKNTIMFTLIAGLFAAMCVTTGWAQAEQPKKINLSNAVKAMQTFKRNQALLKDPEMLERYKRLSIVLQNRTDTQQKNVDQN